MGIELTTGDYERVKFVQVADLSSTFGKFRMEATLKSSEMNEFLNEYKKEMQRRKVLFPGFRPGKLPPYVMPDIRKYLVCYGLESVIGQICNLNGLEMRAENEGEVRFGDDAYYEQIIQEDFRGYNYTKQRDAWREGTDFSFVAEFFARIDQRDGSPKKIYADKAIDTEAVTIE